MYIFKAFLLIILLAPLCMLHAQTGKAGIGTNSPASQRHTTDSVRIDTLKGTVPRPVYVDYDGTFISRNESESFVNNLAVNIPNDSYTGALSISVTRLDAVQTLPLPVADWKSDTIDTSNLVRNAGTYRFLFRVVNNNNNNFFMDDVQVQNKQAGTILPLNLLSFTGEAVGTNKAQLAWRTANEINTTYFELQRSTDGRTFKPVLLMHARGNAQSTTDYSYTDANLAPGLYYYRLRIEDRDGKQTYSAIVSVLLTNKEAITVYPVPAKDAIWVSSSNRSIIGKPMQLTDVQGRLIEIITISQLPQRIDISGLATGTYLLKLPDDTAIKVDQKVNTHILFQPFTVNQAALR